MNYDILISLVNISFVLCIYPQIYRNYKFKNTEIHSLAWHGTTLMGFVVLMYCYVGMDLMFSLITIFLNFLSRAIIILQMFYYKKGVKYVEL